MVVRSTPSQKNNKKGMKKTKDAGITKWMALEILESALSYVMKSGIKVEVEHSTTEVAIVLDGVTFSNGKFKIKE